MNAEPAIELTYDEIREWAGILRCFTAADLAHALGVDHDTGVRAVNALCAQGICRNTGDVLDGAHGYEYVIAYIPPPAGPSRRERSGPDPDQAAVNQMGRINVQRGDPVRIRTGRMIGRALSTPGARQKVKNREREYQKQQEAKTTRAEAQKSKAQKDPKWQKK